MKKAIVISLAEMNTKDIITTTKIMLNIMAINIDFINKNYLIMIVTAFNLHLHLKFKINQKHFN